MLRSRSTARARRVGASVLVVGIMTAALTWFVVLPEHRPGLHVGEQYAVDVSDHQGVIDWDAVAGDGVGFAYLKSTEGRGFVDRSFARNWRESGAAGVRRGAYHFFTECASGREQAANFLRVAPPEPGALRPAVDLEVLQTCRSPVADVDHELAEFVAEVERAWSTQVLVYVRDSWTQRHPLVEWAGRPSWSTSFAGRPAEPWAVWQVHYFARVGGVSERVDLDVVRSAQVQR